MTSAALSVRESVGQKRYNAMAACIVRLGCYRHRSRHRHRRCGPAIGDQSKPASSMTLVSLASLASLTVNGERPRVFNICFNPFPPPGNPHGRPLARRDRPDGAAGPGWVARRRSMVSRLRPGELSIRDLESYRRLLLLFYTSRPWRPAPSEAVAGYVIYQKTHDFLAPFGSRTPRLRPGE